jgi:transcription initiation factor IIE alpha subunit
MNLLMRSNSTDENYDADISFVFVELTPTLARLILRRMAEFKRTKAKDKEALETYFWNRNAIYLRYDKVSEKMATKLNDNGEFIEIARSLSFDDGENTECDQMVVGEGHVYFTAIPKHTSIYIVSDRIPISTIREAAKKTTKKAA